MGLAERPAQPEAKIKDPLIQILVSKGMLTSSDAVALGESPDQRAQLLALLRDKGILTALDYDALTAPSTSAQVNGALVASTRPMVPTATVPALLPIKAEAPKVIAAIAPMRVLQLEPSTVNGMIPDIKLGSGAKVKVYGMVKASAIYDTSAPYGTDMPLPGFINTMTTNGAMAFDPGPTGGSEFHTKARFLRLGTSFEWPEVGKNTAVTGKLEFDFEGNFTRSLNRNISTIRSSQASIRLAYGRIDHKFTDRTSVFGLFGQDWTPFGSSTLPPIYESTGLGLGFGSLYERGPQFRFGVGRKVGGPRDFFIQPEFAIVMSAYGNDPKSMDNQMGYGERQGADSGRPEIQGRFVLQWQFDRALAVAPAQFIVSAVEGKRTALVRSIDIPLCTAAVPACPASAADPTLPNQKVFQNAFPRGGEVSSSRYGWTTELQLPARYLTLITKYWNGADLRWYFVGSLFSNYNDRGLLDTAGSIVEAQSNDASSSVLFGFRGGVPSIAPQRPVRSQGGFVNLGFPLSRMFHAAAGGRNAGWTFYLHYALDVANAQDVRKLGNQRQKNDLAAATLNYKLNNLVTFSLEESYYRTRVAGDPNGVLKPPMFLGAYPNSWHDFRSEFGPTFTF
jgi:hypothetical protein